MEPEITVYPHGRAAPPGHWPSDRPEVSIRDRGCEIVLVFKDKNAEGSLAELRVLPGTDGLEPRVLRRFAPQAELYLASARAALKWNRNDLAGAIEALRQVGRPGRGLSDEFYRAISESYSALVTEGEPHPVKALSQIHNVTIGAASRWVKEARARQYLPPKEAKT